MKWPKEAVYEELTISIDFLKHQGRNVAHAMHFWVEIYVVWKKNSSALKSNKVKPHHFVVASAQIGHLTFLKNN